MKKYINIFIASIPLTFLLAGSVVSLVSKNTTSLSFIYFNQSIFVITFFILFIFSIKLNSVIKEVSPIKNDKINCLISYILIFITTFKVSNFIIYTDNSILFLNTILINIATALILSILFVLVIKKVKNYENTK